MRRKPGRPGAPLRSDPIPSGRPNPLRLLVLALAGLAALTLAVVAPYAMSGMG